MARKVGKAFTPEIQTHKDITGIANTFTFRYRLDDGVGGDWTVVNSVENPVVEISPGKYGCPVTFTVEGLYDFEFISTDPRVQTHAGKVEVTKYNIDEVRDAVAVAQEGINDIKSKIDTLDAGTMDIITEKTAQLSDAIQTINTLISDTDGSNGITSLTELLKELKDAGSNRDSIINVLGDILKGYTDDIENMINGTEFLQDGVTPNPFHGNNNKDIHDTLKNAKQSIEATINSTKEFLVQDAETKYQDVKTRLVEITTLVTYNKGMLDNTTYGLEAIKNKLNSTDTDMKALFEDADSALTSAKDALMTKLDSIENKVDNVLDNQAKWTDVRVIL